MSSDTWVILPDEAGNEDPGWLDLLDRAALNVADQEAS